MAFHVPNEYRLHSGMMGSKDSAGNNGAFYLPPLTLDRAFQCIASEATDEYQWEHVSVCMIDRRTLGKERNRLWIPNWPEMCFVKDTFWDPEDCVIQFHPPASEYVSTHDYVLHLWRPTDLAIPTPPLILIGSVTGQRL